MLKMRVSPKPYLITLFIACAYIVLLSGCSTPEKPKELNELEGILQAPDALEIRDTPGAGKYYREARQYRQVSRKAYEKKDLDEAREYAVLGTMRFRTAAAIKKQVEEANRLQAANAQVSEINPKIKTLNSERNKLVGEVGALEREVDEARSRRELAERREAARQQNRGGQGGSSAERLAARNRIDAAKKAEGEALQVKADEFAANTFSRAEELLASAQRQYDSDSNSARQAEQTASQAQSLFRQAASEARPEFQKQQDPAVRRSALREEASKVFGADYVIAEADSVRVILAMTFDQGSSQVRDSARAQATSAAKLAREYEDAALLIEGYTRAGDPTENLSISGNRARSMRDILVNEDVNRSRISTRGEGQNMQRYPDDPAKNDRVEIIFDFSR